MAQKRIVTKWASDNGKEYETRMAALEADVEYWKAMAYRAEKQPMVFNDIEEDVKEKTDIDDAEEANNIKSATD